MSFAFDVGFKESDHPRGQPKNAGQFAPKGGGSSAKQGEGKQSQALGEGKEGKEGKQSKAEEKIAPRQKQVEGAVGLTNFLRTVSHFHRGRGQPTLQQFVLDNGQPYVANAKTYEGKRATLHQCFKNAALDALHNPDRIYVEGYVSVHGVPIEHAWTVDKTGQIYDSTIRSDQGISGYFGVPFKTEYLMKTLLASKKYGLLGYESWKTVDPLIKGEVRDFKQGVDPDALSPTVIADRVSYADAIVRSIPPTNKIDTPERQALRKEIGEKIYNKDIARRTHNREATIILGLPGAGKSVFKNPLVEKGALDFSNDLAKEMLPEYAGGSGAFAVHEEASGIMRNVLKKVLTNGDDFVWERIDSPDKLVEDIKNLKKAGYKIHVDFMDTPYQEAASSALRRYLKTGRYVSLENIKGYGNSPKAAYEAAVASGLLDSHERRERQARI